MKPIACLLALLLTMMPCLAIQKIACIGASITYGYGIEPRETHCFPAQLQQLLGKSYRVSNYGVNGTTLLQRGNKPYWQTEQYQAALASLPDIVVIDLGGNDSKLVNREKLGGLGADCRAMIAAFRQLASHPRIILLLPIPSFLTDTAQIYDRVIVKHIIPQLQQSAYTEQVEVLDLHALFVDKAALLPDGIHPNTEGAAIYARRLYETIGARRDLRYDIFTGLPANKSVSHFYGYACADFMLADRACKVVKPRWTAAKRPWVWRARFWGHEPQADIALLERGFHIVYCDAAELFGNARAIALWNSFYDLLTAQGLSKKAVLEGMSRGAVYALNWAAENPRRVAGVYVDNPVLDLRSWPGGAGKYPGSARERELLKADYGLTSDSAIKAFAGSPVDKVPQIVAGGYPIFILCGDADELVAPEENTRLFEQRVNEHKGQIKVIYKPGAKHHPHSLPNPTPIVDFILQAASGKRVIFAGSK